MPKVLLLVLDGWGYRNQKTGNALALAKTPVMDSLWKKYPHTTLNAAGSAVGLPAGVMGNSEVGHLTLGAGRIVNSDLVRINTSIKNNSFFRNKVLGKVMDHAKRNHEKLHLLGLLSDAGVHSHIHHLFTLLELAQRKKVKEVYVHAFLDGRDTPPKSAATYITQLQRKMKELNIGTLASMMGRYYAMDRDNRWNREHKAYDCMVNCKGRKRNDPLKALKEAYAKGETDEFIKPTIFTNKCIVDEHDSVIFFNFRSDRARELTRAFVVGKFNQFQRKKVMDLHFATLTQYDSQLRIPVAFAPQIPKNTLGEVISKIELSQLRIAETEKWAHVTYFFNGLCEHIFPYEQRIHIPSRKVTAYDKTPEMKVIQITDTLLAHKDDYDFFLVNFANGDMVGHTGNLTATIKAVEAVDSAIGRIIAAFPGVILITADHGNCEDMQGECSTCHTINKVPLYLITKEGYPQVKKIRSGGLADIAPTILQILDLPKPNEMTGRSLLEL